MARPWVSYRCKRCRWSLELPLLWATHQHALRGNGCRGKLQRVPPTLARRASGGSARPRMLRCPECHAAMCLLYAGAARG
jgi:hypothetical protein